MVDAADTGDILPKINQHRQQRAQLHQHIEHEGLLGGNLPTQQVRDDHQMAGTGNRQEFRQPLYSAQDDGLKDAHIP